MAWDSIMYFLKRLVPALIIIYVFLNPYPHTTAIKEISFYSSILIVIFLVVGNNISFSFRSPLTILFVLFSGWVLGNLFFAINPQNSFHDFYAHLLKYLVLFYLLINFIYSPRHLKILIWSVIISSFFFSVFGIFYYYVTLDYSFNMRFGLPGVAAVNNVGMITVPAFLFSINALFFENKPLRVTFLITCVITTLIGSLLTQTVGILLAMVVAVSILLMRKLKVLIVVLSLLAITVGFMPFHSRVGYDGLLQKIKADDRTQLWYVYSRMIERKPFIGYGFGMSLYSEDSFVSGFDDVLSKTPDKYKPSYYQTPHNIFIDMAVRTGIGGLALFLAIVSTFIYMGLKLARNGGSTFIRSWALCILSLLISFLIQGVFADVLFGPYWVIFFVILGMMSVLWRLDTRLERAENSDY
ncbi:MAG: O-antigen ligase family protein [Deltaproteobacteria bacterium]|nr:O-antigen ligase family protein [Deltaproteobacteria bacterium]